MPSSASAAALAVYLGAQAFAGAGTHTDVAGSQSGGAAALLLEGGVRSKSVWFAFEGIPPVSLPQRPSAFYGQATPQFSMIAGALRFALDGKSRIWVGAGETIVNQRTPLPNISQVVSSRLAGVRYEVLYRIPLQRMHFVELLAGATPSMKGSDYFAYSNGQPPVVKPENAAETDFSAAYGWRHGNGEWLAGIRTLNFSAIFPATGEAADRNSGGGVMLEWRQFIGK